jgi:thiol-disulfide isomerase/thioredoxin
MSKMRAAGAARSRTAQKRGRPQPQQRPARKFPVLPVVFVALSVLLVAAIAFTGGESLSDDERIAETAGNPFVTGNSLLAYSDAAVDPAIGTVAPEITGSDYQGNPVAIEHNGTPKVVLFLAHWCGVCQAEVPRVQAWLNATGGIPGVDMVSITTTYRPAQGNWSPEDWLTDEGWTTPLIRDDASSSAYVAYGGGPFPYWVFLNGDGTVAGRSAGAMSTAQLEQILVELSNA